MDKKRIVSILLCLLMFSAIAFPAIAGEVEVQRDYDYGYIERLTSQTIGLDELLIPVSAGEHVDESAQNVELFNFPGNATRAEAIHMLVDAVEPSLLRNPNTPNNVRRFSDVRVSDWFYPAVSWAYSRGWVTGFTDGTFRPNQTINRQEFVTMMVRARGASAGTINLTFTDRNQIADWAMPHVRRAVQNGWIEGFQNNTFRPTDAFTRNHALTFVRRIRSNVVFPYRDRVTVLVWTTRNVPSGLVWNPPFANDQHPELQWRRIAGTAIGGPLPTAARSNHRFVGWRPASGSHDVNGSWVVPHMPLGSNFVDYFARWTPN